MKIPRVGKMINMTVCILYYTHQKVCLVNALELVCYAKHRSVYWREIIGRSGPVNNSMHSMSIKYRCGYVI